jgi:serine/threonine protein kinase
MMNPNELSVLSRLFDEALDLPDDAARARWLKDLPIEHGVLRPRLEAMLDGRLPTVLERGLRPERFFGPAADAPSEGLAIGPYRLLRPLGQGGMSQVWLAARDGQDPVALKLPTQSAADGGFLARFEREGRFLESLDHPCIAHLVDAGVTEDGRHYLALEYVEGLPLDRHCDGGAGLAVADRITLFRQVLDAVQHAHSRGVLHRDLKPSNILVTAAGQVRLLDFGIAKLMVEGVAAETELTERWGRALTRDYASPEQFIGAPVTPSSDVYSLGVILFELLTGRRPYAIAVGHRHPSDLTQGLLEPPAASESVWDDSVVCRREGGPAVLAGRLAGALDALLESALQHDPARRPRDAGEFAERLDAAMATRRRGAFVQAVTRRITRAWHRQRLGVVLALAALVAPLLLGRIHRLAAGVDVLFARPRPAAQQVALVSIGAGDHQALFQRGRPLPPEPLARLIRAVLAGSPAAVVIDLDTSSSVYSGLQQAFGDEGRQRLVWARELDAEDHELPRPRPVLGGAPAGAVRNGLALSVADGASGQLLWWRPSIPTRDGLMRSLAAEMAPERAESSATSLRAVRYRDTDRLELPASVVLATGFDWGDRIRGRVVLLGGRYDPSDRHPTPLGTLSGLETMAHTVETAQHEPAWQRPSALVSLLLGMMVLCVTVAAFDRWLPGRALAISGFAAGLGVVGLAASGLGPPWPHAAVVVAAVLVGRVLALPWMLRKPPAAPARRE